MTRDWLKEIRASKKISQDTAAKACNMSQQMYSAIENGTRNPSVPHAKAIGKALKFNWTKFYDEEPTNNKSENTA